MTSPDLPQGVIPGVTHDKKRLALYDQVAGLGAGYTILFWNGTDYRLPDGSVFVPNGKPVLYVGPANPDSLGLMNSGDGWVETQ